MPVTLLTFSFSLALISFISLITTHKMLPVSKRHSRVGEGRIVHNTIMRYSLMVISLFQGYLQNLTP